MVFAYLPFPNFDPNVFSFGPFHPTWPIDITIGPIAVRWYALAYIAGILLGWLYIRRLIATKRLWGETKVPEFWQIDDFVTWATLGIILGGRLGYVIFYDPMHYLAEPLDIPQLWHGGMSFHGAVIGLWLTMVLFSRGKEFSAFTLFDLVTAAAPLGLFFGRIANFINGELWGRASDVPWAVVFPRAGNVPRHPSQLYEMALEGLVLFVVLRLVTHVELKLKRPGTVAGAFTACYGLARITAEFFREPDVQVGYLAGQFTMGQLLSVPMVLLGVGVILWANRRRGAKHEAAG
ncbi:MAG: prolipoprotein diacylglyceryl transferase [Ancalomicrobiaceae bacterium]|nr:prolipoprotein diacylglyceryl transferase [Ancalomicrobiaceae bacterium]